MQKQQEDANLPLPTEDQIRWHEAQIGVLICLGLNTYYNQEWGDGKKSVHVFDPSRLDCNQWMEAAKAIGAKYAVLVAKHHDGFCLWPTKTTSYSIASTPYKGGKGDIVREFVDACKKSGIKVGIYNSPWDRHEPCYPDENAYDDFYCAQLEELMTWYDTDIFEFWFDGAGSAGRTYDWNRIMALVKKYHPHAMVFNMGRPDIRWVGNELGFANDPNWNVFQIGDTIDKTNTTDIAGVGLKINDNNGYGNVWLPAECDVPLYNHQWFWHTNSHRKIYPLKRLKWIYEKSIGRGANLLVGLAPNREGLIGDKEMMRLEEWGRFIHQYEDSRALIEFSGEGSQLEFDLGKPIDCNCVILMEDIGKGQRVRKYNVFYKQEKSKTWERLSKGKSIGYKKIDRFKAKSIQKIKIIVEEQVATPCFSRIAFYRIID
jgi:alpha-L-fucosidase